jgi:molybdate transport system regulatory protein
MKAKKKYSARVRVWVEEANGLFLGKGRVILLENIGKTGSITNAAKMLKMSYRQAWQMVKDMNDQANVPLVEKSLGGKGGGGAALTDAGKKAIKSFHGLEKKVTDLIVKESKKLTF